MALFAVPARAESTGDVIDLTTSYFAALQRGDHRRMAQLSSDAILKRAGGEANLAEMYRQAYQNDRERLLRREIIRRVSWFAAGSAKVYLVETTREYESFPEPLSMPYLYAVSASGPNGMRILDLSCISVDWVEEMAPGFRRSALAKELLARGMINPGN